MRHWHSTPFEMCEIKYHIKLPIFIARQWIRHRTANVNEYSARYSILDKEFYIPEKEQLSAQSTANRQGRGDLITGEQADEVLKILKDDATRTYSNYEKMLNEKFDGTIIDENKSGLARELARMNLTLNSYTQWYWKTDLLNLLNFLFLRADSHAQYEIRVYAETMLETVKKWVPITHAAFLDYRVGAVHVSSKGKKVIQKMIKGEKCDLDSSGLSKREWDELMNSFNLSNKTE
jgi:thymidylate synthase (FAD)